MYAIKTILNPFGSRIWVNIDSPYCYVKISERTVFKSFEEASSHLTEKHEFVVNLNEEP